jgi:hypothetical protein
MVSAELWNSSGSDIYYDDGKVGIGTTSPGSLLHVNGASNSIFVSYTDNDNTAQWVDLSSRQYASGSESEGYTLIYGDSNSAENIVNVGGADSRKNAVTSVRFHTAGNSATRQGTEKMRIKGDGKVGIGTTSPTEKLEVAGIVKATSFVGNGSGLTGIDAGKWEENGNEIYYNGGNVGIGISDPQAKLHINGSAGSLSTGLAFGDGDTGIHENPDDSLSFTLGNIPRWYMANNQLRPEGVNGGATMVTDTPSATVPGFTFQGDLDTGVGHAANDNIDFITNGINRMTIDANGEIKVNGNLTSDGDICIGNCN